MKIWISKQSQHLSFSTSYFMRSACTVQCAVAHRPYNFIVAFFGHSTNVKSFTHDSHRFAVSVILTSTDAIIFVKKNNKNGCFNYNFSPPTDYHWNAKLIRILMYQKDKVFFSRPKSIDGCVRWKCCNGKVRGGGCGEPDFRFTYCLVPIAMHSTPNKL